MRNWFSLEDKSWFLEMEVRSKVTFSYSNPPGAGSGIYRALMWKEKRLGKTGLKISQTFNPTEILCCLVTLSPALVLNFLRIFWDTPSGLSSWMQSHTNLALLTNMPRKNARWLQHPCLLLIFREAFQNPSLLNKNMKQLLILEEKKPQNSR